MAKCPFIEPEFVMPLNEPCPVCGMYGNTWSDDDWADADKCVGDDDVTTPARPQEGQ